MLPDVFDHAVRLQLLPSHCVVRRPEPMAHMVDAQSVPNDDVVPWTMRDFGCCIALAMLEDGTVSLHGICSRITGIDSFGPVQRFTVPFAHTMLLGSAGHAARTVLHCRHHQVHDAVIHRVQIKHIERRQRKRLGARKAA